MSDADDVKQEFNRQSRSEKEAILSSWESFLRFAGQVLRITLDIIDILQRLYRILKGS